MKNQTKEHKEKTMKTMIEETAGTGPATADYVTLTIADLEREGNRMLECAAQLRRWHPPEAAKETERTEVTPGTELTELTEGKVEREGNRERKKPKAARGDARPTGREGKRLTQRGGKMLVMEGLRQVLPEMTTEFGVGEMMSYCAAKFKKTPVLGEGWTVKTVGQGLARLMRLGEIKRVKPGVYERAGGSKSEAGKRRTGAPKPRTSGDRPDAWTAGEQRMAAVRRIMIELAAGEEFALADLDARIREADADLARELQTGEIGAVLRALKNEGQVTQVQEPGPGQYARWRKN